MTDDAQKPPTALPAAPARPWEAERVVGRDEVLALVTRWVEVAELVPLGAGWDNSAWLVRAASGERFVFRFPRRRVAVPLLEREVAVLPVLAPDLPLPITTPVSSGLDSSGWPFAGYRFLPGVPLATSGREPDLGFAAAVGGLLRALHQRPAAVGLAGDELGKVDARRRLPVTRGLAERRGVEVPEDLVDLALAVSLTERPRVVVHGDLDGRHVLIDEEGRASGVIDWGDVHLGDPATDLAFAFSALEGRTRDAFFEAYGLVWDGLPTLALARYRAFHMALVVLDWTAELGDDAGAAAARAALERAVKYT